MQYAKIYEVVSRAGKARGLAIAGIIVDLIAIATAVIMGNGLISYGCIAGQFLFLFSFGIYHDYDCRDTIFDKILYVLLYIIVLPTFIFFFIIDKFSDNEEEKEKKVKITNIGDGYVENNYGNYTLVVGNEYSGYSRIPLIEYNSASGIAIDHEGTEYRIG